MEVSYIVRADFYPNGYILPLGITDNSGRSIYINKITKMKKRISTSGDEYVFYCESKDKSFVLRFKNFLWDIYDADKFK